MPLTLFFYVMAGWRPCNLLTRSAAPRACYWEADELVDWSADWSADETTNGSADGLNDGLTNESVAALDMLVTALVFLLT